jgi:hypothetical protein
MKLKRAVLGGLLMIFTVVGLAMGGQINNRRRERRENRMERHENRMERRENRRHRRGRWIRYRRRHRGMRM